MISNDYEFLFRNRIFKKTKHLMFLKEFKCFRKRNYLKIDIEMEKGS